MLPQSLSTLEKNSFFGKATKKKSDVERNTSVLKDWKLSNSEKWETVLMN